MSSTNLHFTIQYQQPAAYHFSHDSVFLARRVFEILQNHPEKKFDRVLDLCAGCGVVGIDYLFHLQHSGFKLPSQIDFLEVQSVYQSYFAQNISKIKNISRFQMMTMNYDQVGQQPQLHQQYDLIVSNPPYFKNEMGKLSPSDFKNRCRFFIDSTFEKLLFAIQYLLKPEGLAFVLLKDLSENGFSIQDELRQLSDHLEITCVEKIRTTDLYRIKRI